MKLTAVRTCALPIDAARPIKRSVNKRCVLVANQVRFYVCKRRSRGVPIPLPKGLTLCATQNTVTTLFRWSKREDEWTRIFTGQRLKPRQYIVVFYAVQSQLNNVTEFTRTCTRSLHVRKTLRAHGHTNAHSIFVPEFRGVL